MNSSRISADKTDFRERAAAPPELEDTKSPPHTMRAALTQRRPLFRTRTSGSLG